MYNEYQIKPNDTLSSIAKDNNISIEELINANDLKDIILKPGEKIIIPVSNDNPFVYYQVIQGDNLYKIADAYGISVENLARLNNININDNIFINERILVPRDGYNIYITKEKETIKDIEKKTGKNISDLLKDNTIYLLGDQLIVYKD